MAKLAPLFLAFALSVASCVSVQESPARRTERSLLTPHDFLGTDYVTAFEVVQRLRPEWLRTHGAVRMSASFPDMPQVVIDGVRAGDLEQLHNIPLDMVREMRFLTPSEASFRFGLNYTSGAILIRTGRG